MTAYAPPLISAERLIGGRPHDFARRVTVMAIVNRTPDSFHDRGRTFALARATEAVQAAAGAGADWIDIGGVPFAPGPEVTAAEELHRVMPHTRLAVASTVADLVAWPELLRTHVTAALPA